MIDGGAKLPAVVSVSCPGPSQTFWLDLPASITLCHGARLGAFVLHALSLTMAAVLSLPRALDPGQIFWFRNACLVHTLCQVRDLCRFVFGLPRARKRRQAKSGDHTGEG